MEKLTRILLVAVSIAALTGAAGSLYPSVMQYLFTSPTGTSHAPAYCSTCGHKLAIQNQVVVNGRAYCGNCKLPRQGL